MATKEIQLHGGPWHGRRVAVQEGVMHFHITAPLPAQLEVSEGDQTTAEVQTRRGTYSRVFGQPNDFEWDGFNT